MDEEYLIVIMKTAVEIGIISLQENVKAARTEVNNVDNQLKILANEILEINQQIDALEKPMIL
jgi:septal ring factor EnvC (AmiA/AmiB activator)